MLTKLQALEELGKWHTHEIVTTEFANKLGKPFGIVFETIEFKFDPEDWKGPSNDCAGVDIFSITSRIADVMGCRDRRQFLGRGSQAREDLKLSLEAVRAEMKVS